MSLLYSLDGEELARHLTRLDTAGHHGVVSVQGGVGGGVGGHQGNCVVQVCGGVLSEIYKQTSATVSRFLTLKSIIIGPQMIPVENEIYNNFGSNIPFSTLK